MNKRKILLTKKLIGFTTPLLLFSQFILVHPLKKIMSLFDGTKSLKNYNSSLPEQSQEFVVLTVCCRLDFSTGNGGKSIPQSSRNREEKKKHKTNTLHNQVSGPNSMRHTQVQCHWTICVSFVVPYSCSLIPFLWHCIYLLVGTASESQSVLESFKKNTGL